MAINKKLIHFQRLASFKEQLAANNILDTSIVFIKDAQQIWTHGQYYAVPEGYVKEAPEDGSSYIRRNKSWEVLQEKEVYVGTIEPSTDYKLWADSSTDELKYYNGEEWIIISGAKEVMETMLLTLSSNQTQPDSNLTDISIVVEYSDIQEVATWKGSELTFSIPMGLEYTITVGEVEGYATPAVKTYTAVAGVTRSVTMIYNKTKLTVNRSSNQSEDLGESTVTATYGSKSQTKNYSSGVNSVVFDIPTRETVTLTFSGIDGYATPQDQSVLVEDATASCTGTYQTEILTLNVSSTGGTLSGYSINISNVGTQTTSTGTYKIPFGTTYKITASEVDEYITPVDNTTYTANQASRTITVTYVYSPPTDLSMVDIYGNKRASATTANCYVVKESGTYRIPLVYGNAIVNGSTNGTSYRKNNGSHSMKFVNYKGAQIVSPFIEADTSKVVSSAQLSIADTDNIFTDISVVSGGTSTTSISNCGYIRFTVASIPDTGANGVISIKDSSGIIMWNWHIWVWKDSLTPVTITNYSRNTYNILPVNLASKWDKSSSTPTQIKNWFYQWGRPTPMLCPAAYNSSSNATSYGALKFSVESRASDFQMGIKNPTTFYKGGTYIYDYGWFDTSGCYNLWDQACTSAGCSDNNVVKTVYDPCPPGFKMPNGNTFTGFATRSDNSPEVVGKFKNGWYFKKNSSDTTGVFFPASGERKYTHGELISVGEYGQVWSSASYDLGNVYKLEFNEYRADYEAYYLSSYGLSVRPVTES